MMKSWNNQMFQDVSYLPKQYSPNVQGNLSPNQQNLASIAPLISQLQKLYSQGSPVYPSSGWWGSLSAQQAFGASLGQDVQMGYSLFINAGSEMWPPAQCSIQALSTVKIELLDRELWQRFHVLTCEMVITRSGRYNFN